MSERKAYPSDLSDAEWPQIEPLMPGPLPGGRPAKDALGLIWLVPGTAASVAGPRRGAFALRPALLPARPGTRAPDPGDSAYQAGQLWAWIKAHLPRRGLRLEVVGRDAEAKGFVVLQRRRVVERTFGWLNKCRHLSKGDKRHTRNSETMIRLASIHLMTRSLASQAA